MQNPSNFSANSKHDGGLSSIPLSISSIPLSKGERALRGRRENSQGNSATRTTYFSMPLSILLSRNVFWPKLGLRYNSDSGNSVFGLRWNLSISSITCKVERKLYQYLSKEKPASFLFPNFENLASERNKEGKLFSYEVEQKFEERLERFTVHRPHLYLEGTFAPIEQWQNKKTGSNGGVLLFKKIPRVFMGNSSPPRRNLTKFIIPQINLRAAISIMTSRKRYE